MATITTTASTTTFISAKPKNQAKPNQTNLTCGYLKKGSDPGPYVL